MKPEFQGTFINQKMTLLAGGGGGDDKEGPLTFVAIAAGNKVRKNRAII